MNENEIVLSEKNGQTVLWCPDKWAPFQVRKNGKIIFSSRITEIWEWAETPESHRARAELMAKRAGQTVRETAIIAYCCPNVYVINSPELGARIRELMPAARKLHEEAEAKKAAEEAERAAALERRRGEVRAACPEGFEPCELGRWFDGLRECIAADGTRVDQWDDIDAHGCGIAYVPRGVLDKRRAIDAEQREAAAKRAEKREAEKREAEERRAAAFAEAKATGKRVEIRHWATDRCMNGNDDQCSLDNAYEYAMPDGTAKVVYVCAF